jgi:hypothetical protein
MIPNITVFQSGIEADLINKFHTLGYKPYYDSKHGRNEAWLREMLTGNHRLFTWSMMGNFDYAWYAYEVNEIEKYGFPSFMIIYDNVTEMSDDDWRAIHAWVKFRMNNEPTFGPIISHAESLLEKPTTLMMNLKSEDSNIDNEKYEFVENGVKKQVTICPPEIKQREYEFRRKLVGEWDCMFYELTRHLTVDEEGQKPFAPFVVIVHPFSAKGHEYFFSDIYASHDWDVNKREGYWDFWALQQIWKSLCMPGEFTMKVVERIGNLCYPCKENEFSARAEPVVHRNTLENVMEFYKEQGRVYELQQEAKKIGWKKRERS